MHITIYTDGGCSGNPGPGGWAYVMNAGGGTSEASGGEALTTNNRMELTAVIRALEAVGALPEPSGSIVDVHTDSQYVQLGITQWAPRWAKNGWKTSGGEAVKNRELWQRLAELTAALKTEWHWVRGHAGNELNERCDELVQLAIARVRAAPS